MMRCLSLTLRSVHQVTYFCDGIMLYDTMLTDNYATNDTTFGGNFSVLRYDKDVNEKCVYYRRKM